MQLPFAAGFLPRTSTSGTILAYDFFRITSEQKANAPSLEAALESLLREQKACEEIIMLFRVQGVLTRDIFCGLDTEEAGFRTICKESFGIDTDKGFLRRVELSQLVFAWNTARTHAEAKTRVLTQSREPTASQSLLLPLIGSASSTKSRQILACTSRTSSCPLSLIRELNPQQRHQPTSFPYTKKTTRGRSDPRFSDSRACIWIPLIHAEDSCQRCQLRLKSSQTSVAVGSNATARACFLPRPHPEYVE